MVPFYNYLKGLFVLSGVSVLAGESNGDVLGVEGEVGCDGCGGSGLEDETW